MNIGEIAMKKVIDFLFYKGEISGYTFESLSASTKLKVLKLALSIDQKVEKYFLFNKCMGIQQIDLK